LGAAIVIYYGQRNSAGAQSSLVFTRNSGDTPASSTGAQIALRAGRTLTIARPTTTATNDVMIASIAVRPASGGLTENITVTPPSGWTLVDRMDNTSTAGGAAPNSLLVYWKAAGSAGSDPGPYTWTLSSTSGAAGGIQSFSGVSTSSPINAHAGANAANSSTFTAPSITTTIANTMLVASFGYSSASTWTAPCVSPCSPASSVTMTEGFEAASLLTNNSVGISLESAYVLRASTGATPNNETAKAAGGNDDTGNTHMLALNPATAAVNNFGINVGSGTASTCTPRSITLTARDVSNNTLTSYTGTVNLSTSTGHGNWAKSGTANGTLNPNPGTADNGVAAYTFGAADNGVVVLTLSDTHADDLTVTAVDSIIPASSSTSITLSYRDNVFVVSSTDTLGTVAVAGRNHAMKAEFWKKDPSTGNCSIDTNYNGNQTIDAWYIADADHPSGATAPSIYSGTPPAPGTACSGSPNWAPLTTSPVTKSSVPFANGVWNFCLATSDVGKYSINLRDTSRNYAKSVDVATASASTLTVRPFALAITGIAKGATANPEGTASSGAKFIAAGDTFQASVGGYLWQSADDANNDGTPDSNTNIVNNGLTPRFAWATTLSATNTSPYFTPSGGTLGTLGGTTSIAATSYASGQATVSNLSYPEVGSFQMQASASNYLCSAPATCANPGVSVTGASVGAASGVATQIGRFYPDHFTLTASNVTGACSAGGFSYMDQAGIGVSFTIEARNLADVKTSNYGSGYTVSSVSAVAENANAGNGAALGARLSGFPTASWSGGQYSASGGSVKLARNTTPDGPYDSLQLGVQISDAFDSANFPSTALNMKATTANDTCASSPNAASCDAQTIGATTRQRFGRLRVFNANGSELASLPVTMQTEYWNGTGFVINTLDSCTTITTANLGLGNYQPSGQFASGQSTPTIGSGAFAGGQKTITFSAPGATHAGSLDMVVNLGTTTTPNACVSLSPTPAPTGANLAHLRGQWCSTGYTRDPFARVTFGGYQGARQFIYQRENY
ncbi:MAG TPA: DUF6701 domain-containing protein, partial [Burkholderiales bacterium]|nr:DUF6701 domain-containing protein [Burkholderiales bacterium]